MQSNNDQKFYISGQHDTLYTREEAKEIGENYENCIVLIRASSKTQINYIAKLG